MTPEVSARFLPWSGVFFFAILLVFLTLQLE